MEFLEVAKAIGDLTVLIVIAGAVIFLLVKYFSKKIDTALPTQVNKPVGIEYDSVLALKDSHPYFNRIYSILNIKIPITKIGGPVRTEIFRDVLTVFYDTQKENICHLLDKNITKENFLNENLKTVNQIIGESDRRMSEFGIPKVVRTKFWEWYEEKQEYIINTLSEINGSVVFETTVEKQYAALSLYQNSAYFTMMGAERTLRRLNGDLTGTIYNGKIIESLEEM